MSIGLIVSFTGVLVAGLAGILGVWMEKDPEGSKMWAAFFSAIILVATGVEVVHTGYQSYVDGATDARMAQLLLRLSELSEKNPELDQFVAAELAVQQRANPEMVQRLEKKVAASGGDPKAIQRKAAAGRRQAAGLGATPGERPARPRPAPKATTTAAASEAPAPAPSAPPPPSPELVAAAASGDPDAALKAAQAQADQILAAANADASAMKAEAQKVQQQAEATMAKAKKLEKDAKALMDKAKALPGVGGGGGGGGKGGGGGSKPKIPGL